jgi:hypothetical protein
MVRQPAVAGSFYPAEKARLAAVLDSFLTAAQPISGIVAGVAPHAGYVYSGAAAGALYSIIEPPANVVIMGPNHHGIGAPYGIFDKGSWRTPLGDVPIAETLAAAIVREVPFLQSDESSHAHEHSIEVQVPFLQRLRSDVKIVPISIAEHDLRKLMALGSAIARATKSIGVEVLVIASSDMSHDESADDASRKDRMAIERMLAFDEEGLWQVVRRHDISMCGVAPAIAAMAAAREMGAQDARLIKYTNSGEVTGDIRRVVGYASIAFARTTDD